MEDPRKTLGGPVEGLRIEDPWRTLGRPLEDLVDPWRTRGGPKEDPWRTPEGPQEDPWRNLGGIQGGVRTWAGRQDGPMSPWPPPGPITAPIGPVRGGAQAAVTGPVRRGLGLLKLNLF